MFKKTVYTPIGSLVLTEEDGLLSDISWLAEHHEDSTRTLEHTAEELQTYLEGKRTTFSAPYAFKIGTPFERRVWQAIAEIPYGQTVTYGDLAKDLKSGPRAVGTACGKNPIPLIVPCHRVVGYKGKITGYSGGDGVLTKELLLHFEKWQTPRTSTTPIFDSLRQSLPQKPFYFMRHAQTDANAQKVLHGRSVDLPLNAVGQAQATKAGQMLAAVFNPKTVWHSDMLRTKQTAEIVLNQLSQQNRIIKGHKNVAERSFGIYEGKKNHEIPSLRDIWQSNPEGDTWLGFTHRLASGLKDILSESKTTPFIVSHAASGSCIGEFLGAFPRNQFMKNCQIWYVEPPKDSPLNPWRMTEVYQGE